MNKQREISDMREINRIIDIINESDSFDFGDELLLFDNWIYSRLPKPLKDLFYLIEKPRSRDISLLTTLTIIGAVIKNFQSLHDETWIGTQLYFYLLGNPGHGKSVAGNLKSLGSLYHKHFINKYEWEFSEFNALINESKKGDTIPPEPKRRFLYTPGDTTKAALIRQINENNGYGFIFLNEADTLKSAIYGQYGDFKDMLKNGFDGQPYSASRAKSGSEIIEIDSLNLSVVLTSTINQCFELIPTSEDGLFSRFMFYIIPPDYNFDNVFQKKDVTQLEKIKQKIALNLLVMGVRSEKSSNKIFEFTKKQSEELYFFFSDLKDAFGENQHSNLLGSVNRLAVIIRKIVMVLSYSRIWDEKSGKVPDKIICRNIDFRIALSIVNKLSIHLLAVEYLYQKNNSTQRNLAFIPSNSDLDDGNKNKNHHEKFRANLLRNQGLSFRQISVTIFGDNKHPGTIKRWVEALKKKPFPFPETETPYRKGYSGKYKKKY